MKRYLREIELAGVCLMAVGVALSLLAGTRWGAGPCGCGLLLLLATFVYKAFHWETYARENKQNIVIVLLAIALMLFYTLRA